MTYDKWRESWNSNITSKLKVRQTVEDLDKAVEDSGMAVVDEEDEVYICPIMQDEIHGEAYKNPNCNHIYSAIGYQHLFRKANKHSAKCPVAGCPRKVEKFSIINLIID